MRIFSFFIRLIFLGLAIGGLIYLFGGVLWLKVGTFGFVQDINELAVYEKHLATYVNLCTHAPQSSAESTPFLFQLRFVDGSHYILELVCTLIEDSPIELKRGVLPYLITKVPGSSGYVFPVGDHADMVSAVRLRSLGKEMGIELRGSVVTKGSNILPQVEAYPRNQCSAFGYYCCDADGQVGQGETLTTAITDCPGRCFSMCRVVPVVTLFNSDPQYNQETREISMSGTSLDVIFNYAISPKTVKNVRIDYGDGNHQDSTFAEGIFTHTYACSANCKYTAVLSAEDSTGAVSVESSSAKIYIIKR